jgi:glycerol uptake facilitator-like aquaporin
MSSEMPCQSNVTVGGRSILIGLFTKNVTWVGEAIATFGLILAILGTLRHRPQWLPASVALYITTAYWFTSSTSLANRAIPIARRLSDTFTGIAPQDVPPFVLAQLLGAAMAAAFSRFLFED